MLGTRVLLRVGTVALCALTAHAALYRCVFPSDGVHGYFGWYEPAVATLSLVSALAIGAAAVAAALGRRSRMLATLHPPTLLSAVRLATLAVGWLVVQETIERSVTAGGFELATFGASGWAIVLGVSALAATALTLLGRVGAAFVATMAAPSLRRIARRHAAPRAARPARLRRRRALADRRGLRAPPTPA